MRRADKEVRGTFEEAEAWIDSSGNESPDSRAESRMKSLERSTGSVICSTALKVRVQA